MAMKTILAVAVGPQKGTRISARSGLSGVRPYIEGLMDGLDKSNHGVGTDYVVEYRECDQKDLESGNGAAATFSTDSGSQEDLLIFGMSTTVVRAALRFTKKVPVIGIVSEPKIEGFTRAPNFSGVSGRRSQTAGQCFERFLATVPSLKQVRVLHKPGYGPSERALKLVKAVARKRGVTVTDVPVKSRQDIEKKLSAMPKRDPNKPAVLGVQVLPIDVCLSAAQLIVELAQQQRNIPVFFPITDGVTRGTSGPLGGFGVPQRKCGELMAEHVEKILWQKATTKSLKIKEAPDDTFEWAINSAAAKALNIKIPRVI